MVRPFIFWHSGEIPTLTCCVPTHHTDPPGKKAYQQHTSMADVNNSLDLTYTEINRHFSLINIIFDTLQNLVTIIRN